MRIRMVRGRKLQRWERAVVAAGLVLAASTVGLVVAPAAEAAGGSALVGTFALTPGSCAGGGVSGTYLRMILPSGGPSGPYLSNSDSRCGDQSYTTLNPGTEGGLTSGSYQPQPSPPFDAKGNALAGTITAPAQFYGTSFATSANKVDPQTKRSVGAPSVTASGSTLHADLRGFAVTWNSQYFNQGSPKPDGSYPGNTRPATGTYDATTGAFTLNWTSQVVGGPFDKFTGQWHLQGVFHPAGHGHSPVPTRSAGHSSTPTVGATVPTVPTVPSGAGVSAPVVPGATVPSVSGSSSATVAPTAPSAGAANASPVSLSTSTSTRTTWHVAGWLLAVLIAVAVLGFVALWRVNRAPGTGADS